MAKIAFFEVLGCVNRDENGQKVVGRMRFGRGRVLGRVRAGEPGARWGASGVAGHAPGGHLRGARRAGGIWVVRASWAGGEAGCPPVAPACPARPRTAGLRLPTPAPACRQAAHPRAPCWPSRPPVALATSARPRTAGLPTPCHVPPSAPFRARHANSDGFAPIGRPLPSPAGSSYRPFQRQPGETTILPGLRFACWRHQGCKTVRICRSGGYFQGSGLAPRFARSRRPVPRARASPGNPRPSFAGWSAAARRAPPPARGFSAQPGAWRGAGTPVRLY